MTHNQCLRFTALTVLLTAMVCSTAIAKPRKSVRAFPQAGFWVVETSPQNRQSTIRFYNDNREVIYEEVINRRLKIQREKTQDQLNAVLNHAMDLSAARQPLSSDQKLVAMQLKR